MNRREYQVNSENKQIHAYCDDVLGIRDGLELAALISAGEIHKSEAVNAAIARTRKVNPTLNAIVTETFEQARNQNTATGNGLFSGIPSFIKDNETVKGIPTLHGSRALPSRPAESSSPFVKQFFSAGLVSLGKTTLSEFGFTATTEPLATGPTRNPWDPDYSTGGSSGGSAALVAAGVVPLAHGNDGGGSIRIPASCCGLVGLKPTRGRLAHAIGTEKMPINIVCNGVISRSVRDTAAFYAAAEGFYRNPDLPEIGLVQHPGKERLRIGLFTETPHLTASNPDSFEIAINAGKLCESLGHLVEEISYPFESGIMEDFIFYWCMLAFVIHHFGRKMLDTGFNAEELENWTLGLSRFFRKRFIKTPFVIRRLKKFYQEYEDLFSNYDILLSPTLSHSPPKIGHIGPAVDFDTHFERVRRYVSFTPPQNITGAPAISLPMGFCPEGLPIGLQFAASFGHDKRLLELALELEEAQPWPLVGH